MLSNECPSCTAKLFKLKIFPDKMNDQVKECLGDSGVFCLSKNCDVNFAKLLQAGKGKKSKKAESEGETIQPVSVIRSVHDVVKPIKNSPPVEKTESKPGVKEACPLCGKKRHLKSS